MIRKLDEWTAESERAVSPVIGVILMVAITVILAAVIGSFVLGIGGDINETPQVRLEVSDASATLNGSGNQSLFVISHDGGSELTDSNLQLRIEDSSDGSVAVYNGDTDTATDGTSWSTTNNVQFTSSTGLGVSVGGSTTVTETTNSAVTDGTQLTVTVVHKPSDSIILDQTVTVT